MIVGVARLDEGVLCWFGCDDERVGPGKLEPTASRYESHAWRRASRARAMWGGPQYLAEPEWGATLTGYCFDHGSMTVDSATVRQAVATPRARSLIAQRPWGTV